MRVSDVFQSKYVSANDVAGRELTMKIAQVSSETFQARNGGNETLPTVLFEGATKWWVINKTNAHAIASAFGDEMNDWVGHQLVLFTVKTQNQAGQSVDGIRCRPVAAPTPAQDSSAFGNEQQAPATVATNPPHPSTPDPLHPGDGSPDMTASRSIDDDIPF